MNDKQEAWLVIRPGRDLETGIPGWYLFLCEADGGENIIYDGPTEEDCIRVAREDTSILLVSDRRH